MNFTKDFLRENVEQKARYNIHKRFPQVKGHHPNLGERTPLEFLSINEITFFDESSEKFKSIMLNVLREINENCYKTELNGKFFPNEDKVEYCKKNYYLKYFQSYEKKKMTYIFNSILLFLIN